MANVTLGSSSASHVYIGNTAASKVYLGSSQVWGAGGGGSGTTTSSVDVGQNTISQFTDGGNANILLAQQLALSLTGTLQSLSIYCDSVGGQVVLGFYADSNGAPGALLATTASFTPVAGWNTQPVVSTVDLNPGNYWLAHLPSSNAFGTRKSVNHNPGGVYYNYSFGALPNTFSPTYSTTDTWWSFYATLTTTADVSQSSVTAFGKVAGLYCWYEVEWFVNETITMGTTVQRVGPTGGMEDTTFAACLAAGQQVMVTIYPDSGYDANGDPTIAGVNALLDQQLNRYGPNGTYWNDNPSAPYIPVDSVEILNEPNYYLFGSQAQKAATYAPILKSAYTHVKANWPTVKVVGFSIADSNSAAEGFLDCLYTADPTVFQYFDIFSFHPYTNSDNPNTFFAPDQTITESWGEWTVWGQVANIRDNLVASYGAPANTPFWITEMGFPISQAEGGAFNSGADPEVTAAQQAAYSIRTDIFCMRQDIERCFHMYTTDADGFNGGYFVDSPRSVRPVAVATGFMQSLITTATSMEVIAETYGSGSPFLYKFTTPTTTVQVAWAQTSQTASIAVSGSTTVYDMLGAQIATTSASNYNASLSENPIWLVSS